MAGTIKRLAAQLSRPGQPGNLAVHITSKLGPATQDAQGARQRGARRPACLRNKPSRARCSGRNASRLRPRKEALPAVTSYTGCPTSTCGSASPLPTCAVMQAVRCRQLTSQQNQLGSADNRRNERSAKRSLGCAAAGQMPDDSAMNGCTLAFASVDFPLPFLPISAAAYRNTSARRIGRCRAGQQQQHHHAARQGQVMHFCTHRLCRGGAGT